jgi:hypothetical protein
MIIETLMPQIDGGGLYQSFTVNTAVANVQPNVLPAHVGVYCPLVSPNITGYFRCFQPQDSIQVISCGVFLPYNFSLGSTPIYLRLGWADEFRTHTRWVEQFSNTGMVILPAENAEHVQNVLLSWPTILTGKVGLMAEVYNSAAPAFWPAYTEMNISMLNVPAALNGQTMYIYPWVKVQHTLPMVVGS